MRWTPNDLVKVLLSVIPKCYLRAGDQNRGSLLTARHHLRKAQTPCQCSFEIWSSQGPLVWRKAGVLQVRGSFKTVGRRMSTVHEILFVRRSSQSLTTQTASPGTQIPLSRDLVGPYRQILPMVVTVAVRARQYRAFTR